MVLADDSGECWIVEVGGELEVGNCSLLVGRVEGDGFLEVVDDGGGVVGTRGGDGLEVEGEGGVVGGEFTCRLVVVTDEDVGEGALMVLEGAR